MTAYAPRISAVQLQSTDITDDTETAVGTINVGGASNVNNQLLVEGVMILEAGTDTTSMVISLYVGPFPGGTEVANQTLDWADQAGQVAGAPFALLVDLTDQQPPELYTLTVSFVGASASGGCNGGVVAATVF